MIAVMGGAPRSSRSAPAVTVADFRARFPEFAANSDEQVQTALDDAKPWNGIAAWGTFYTQGVCTLAAHTLAVSNQRAAGNGSGAKPTGIIRQKTGSRAGALSNSFGNWTGYSSGGSSSIPAWLAQTGYGVEWYGMARIRGIGALVVPPDDMPREGDLDWSRQHP
jgi:hypothetical protein